MAEKVVFKDGSWHIPNNPEIGYITGDGIGVDVTPVALDVINAAVKQAYGETRKIDWKEILVGEKALAQGKELLSQEALEQIKSYRITLKGPLTTPIGSGHRSLNVSIRQKLNLFACVRPVRYFAGVPSPMKEPEKVNLIIFRENTEDVYAGIEFSQGSVEAQKIISFLTNEMNSTIKADSGVGIKTISITATKRLIRSAIQYAIDNKRSSVTIVHQGNIMKFTEGAFKEWAYQVAREEFPNQVTTEENPLEGKIIIKDRIADSMFQQLLLRPAEYDIIATTNLNGDYLSDACAAQVGGLGLAPGANIDYNNGIALFEATHGTAPKYAGLDKVNPGSLILSGVMMLELMAWQEAADLIVQGMKQTIQNKTVTYDLERQMENATLLKSSEFGQAIIENLS